MYSLLTLSGAELRDPLKFFRIIKKTLKKESLADPSIYSKRGKRGEGAMYQPRRHLSQMNHTRFYRGKDT